MAHSSSSSADPIAIISVHGVADQLPYDSARQIAKLLVEYDSGQGSPVYPYFAEKEFHISESHQFQSLPILQQDGINLDDKALSQSDQFIIEQLGLDEQTLSSQQQVLSSLRLEGHRQMPQNPKTPELDPSEQPLHIYEMYWADLSRLQNDFLRIFSEFYQILFHLSRIGRRSVKFLRDSHDRNNSWCWLRYYQAQKWAERCLTLGIPFLNVFMFITAFVMIPLSLSPSQLTWVVNGSMLLSLALLLGEISWRSPEPFLSALQKSKTKSCLAIFGWGVICYLTRNFGLYHYVAFVSAALLAAIATFGIERYNQRRPHAKQVLFIPILVWAILFACFVLASSNTQAGVIAACLRTIEVMFFPLILVWILFNLAQVSAAILGVWLSNTHPDKKARSQISRGAWTARLSLSLPSALFLLVTLTLWYVIAKVSHNLIPTGIPYTPLIPDQFMGESVRFADLFTEKLIIVAATSLFPLIILAIAIALVISICALLPSIGAEIFRFSYTEDPEITKRFERWLTRGLGWLYIGTELITLIMILFSLWNLSVLGLKLMQIFPWTTFNTFADRLLAIIANFDRLDITENLLGILFIVIASSATSLIALGSRLAKFTSGIRNLLDVVLDVDSYLRMHPKGRNPKALIFKRYLSLLRYICGWINPNQPGQKYSAIIIIAHSQGTVITADLLRFLNRFLATKPCNSSLDRLASDYNCPDALPVYLYTMGSPLKQLYSYAFPSLYDWMDDLKGVDNFGLKGWLNVYCSADYVGRSLWSADQKPPEGFSEVCLGAGAHTHYWDSTSPKVAQYLDQLILEHTPGRSPQMP